MYLRFRIPSWLTGLSLAAAIAFLPSCKKKETSGGDPILTPPTAVTSDHFLFAHLRAQDVRNSPFFAELKDVFLKSGEGKTWDELEQKIEETIGAKPSHLVSTTFIIPESPGARDDLNRLVLIQVADAPLAKTMLFEKRLRPSERYAGFYETSRDMVVHFPDHKTLVLLHTDFIEKYLNGYAKDRTAWPMSTALIKATEGHTLFATHNPSLWPAEARKGRDIDAFLPLFEAKSAVLTIDLKGKEFHIGMRGTFANAEAANAGKTAMQSLIAEAAAAVARIYENPAKVDDLGPVLAPLKEAHRALTQANVAVSGADVTATTVFKADFNIGEMMTAAVEKVRTAAARTKAMNNLKQIGVAFHNCDSATNQLPILGVGKNGEQVRSQPGKNGEPILNPKPLLSWRVAILPYIEESNLYNQFKHDEPWDSEHNKKLIEKMPKIYAPITKPGKPGMTHLQQIIGPTCMMPGRFSIGNIPDGTSNTIAVVEAAEPVIWTKPDDVYFPEEKVDAPPPKDLKKKFGGLFANGFNALMWDGSVRWIDLRFVSDRTLWDALRPADGNVLGSDW